MGVNYKNNNYTVFFLCKIAILTIVVFPKISCISIDKGVYP